MRWNPLNALSGEYRALLDQIRFFEDQLLEPETDVARNSRQALLVPGYFGPLLPSHLRGLSEHLREEGMDTAFLNYRFWESLEDNVGEIADKLYHQYTSDNQKISAIGHSLGGLVVRDLLTKVPEVFDNAIFLGTPHHGTKMAYLNFFVPVCRDMFPSSDYLLKLNSRALPDNIPILNLVSAYDQMVTPWESALLPEGNNVKNKIVYDVGHIGLISKRMFTHISRHLGLEE